MVSQQLLRKLIDLEDEVVPTLFKPVQFRIVGKLARGGSLTDNEKRYLRGNVRKKLDVLEELEGNETAADVAAALLSGIGSYYITGFEALKHNGYGWYFETKAMEIMNTRIEGTARIGKGLRFVRVKSVKGRKYLTDKGTGLKYATNEQVLKDAKLTKNEHVRSVWMQMLSRYGKLFARGYGKPLPGEKTVDYGKFGV